MYLGVTKVQNVLGIENNYKTRNSCFYENFYSQNCRMLPIFDKLFGYYLWKENILYNLLKTKNVLLKRKKLIYHNEEKRATI